MCVHPFLSLLQAERFEFLKNAPVESFARGITNLKVQPVGKVSCCQGGAE
jgi:hypothetical protein